MKLWALLAGALLSAGTLTAVDAAARDYRGDGYGYRYHHRHAYRGWYHRRHYGYCRRHPRRCY